MPVLLSQQASNLRKSCICKVIRLQDEICKYSIGQEQLRGESIEEIKKRMDNAKLRKQRQKMMMMGNKAEKTKQTDDDEDNDSEDKKQWNSLLESFVEQSNVMQLLFDFIDEELGLDVSGSTILV